ncbi:MAG TPA: ISKra4 family transposase [Streptosporangiaceae bacterium]|nr:ISKra4 family transposase [Streptosporangiaceae bacterium]
METVEPAIRAAMLRLGGRLLEGPPGLDAGHRGPRAGCGNGHQAQFISYRAKTIDTVVGPVRLHRAWYHCAACGHGLAPRDAELGTERSSLSPGLAKMIARAAAAVPFARAAGLLSELAGIELTVKRTERSAEATGTAATAAIAARADAISSRRVLPLPPPDPVPDMLYIAVDGTGVPVVAREAEGRTGKAEDGNARTREVKLACLFTQTTRTDDGYPVRDTASSTYLETFQPAGRSGHLVNAEARRRGAEHTRQLVFLGDGAAWIWHLADQLFPAATQIVDLYHAREHLHELANLAARLLAGHRDDWLAARLDELDSGNIEAILHAGRDLNFRGSLSRERNKALAYFASNAHRMRYQHFRDLGMFVGSGVVEAGCKSIIGQRLKLSGMRWTIHGATSIATLRCQDASGNWDEIWQRPRNQTQLTDHARQAS